MAGSGNESDKETDRLYHDMWVASGAVRMLRQGFSPWSVAQLAQKGDIALQEAKLRQFEQAAKDFGYCHDVWIAYWHSRGLPVPPMPPDAKDPL